MSTPKPTKKSAQVPRILCRCLSSKDPLQTNHNKYQKVLVPQRVVLRPWPPFAGFWDFWICGRNRTPETPHQWQRAFRHSRVSSPFHEEKLSSRRWCLNLSSPISLGQGGPVIRPNEPLFHCSFQLGEGWLRSLASGGGEPGHRTAKRHGFRRVGWSGGSGEGSSGKY